VSFEEIADETGFDKRTVWETTKILKDAGYLDAYHAGAFSGFVGGVTERTRRELGSWPSPESIVDRLAQAFLEAAEQESEPERESKLRAAAEGLGGAGRAVAVDLFSAFLRQQAGLP
jgi:hypothetical protein